MAEASPPAPSEGEEEDQDNPARGIAAELTALRQKVQDSSSAYEAERKVVESLEADALQRTDELASLRDVLRSDAERHEHELRCESGVANAALADLEYNVRLAESSVQRLRYQSEECKRLERENSEMKAELHDITAKRNDLGRTHAGRMHDMQSELLHLRQQLEVAFKRALGEKIRHHYEAAFTNLELHEKEALLHHAQLREEVSLQHTGMEAVALRGKIESEQLTILQVGIDQLHKEQDLRAVAAAKTRHRRDNAQSLARRLERTVQRVECDRRKCIDDSIAMLKSSPHFSLGQDGDRTADELTDSDRASMIQRGLRQLEAKATELKTQVETAEMARSTWARRLASLRRISRDVCDVSSPDAGNAAQPVDRLDPRVVLEGAARVMVDLDRLETSEESLCASRHRHSESSTDDSTQQNTTARDALDATTIQRILHAWEVQDAIGTDTLSRSHSVKSATSLTKKAQLRRPPKGLDRTRRDAQRRRHQVPLHDSLSAKTIAVDRSDMHSSMSLPSLVAKPHVLRQSLNQPRNRGAIAENKAAKQLPVGVPGSLVSAQRRATLSIAMLSTSQSAPILVPG